MRIGMTYDLRDDYLAKGYGLEETAEFDRLDTIEAIEGALRQLGHWPERIGNIRELARRLVAGERWDLVFNIAEGLKGMGREAQVPALLEAFDIPYTFSDPLVTALTLHKGMAKRVMRDAGVPTAPFAIVEGLADISDVDLPFPLFAKPAGEGTGKGITPASRIADRRALDEVCRELLHRFSQPVLVETYLPGREFTVGILGSGPLARVLQVMEVLLNERAEEGAYSYLNKEHFQERVIYRLADDAEAVEAGEVALAAWRILGCRDAGRVDLRSDQRQRPQFLEVNPLAGINPERSDLPIMCRLAGMDFVELIGAIVQSALLRVPLLSMPARSAAE
ncbi:MAG TPA: D-alanine--D-alanine ligase [Alphaproteobacteria bacterium]|nr:D-alanine--D-alanine ligase [Alphaproteobacteria bacterium]